MEHPCLLIYKEENGKCRIYVDKEYKVQVVSDIGERRIINLKFNSRKSIKNYIELHLLDGTPCFILSSDSVEYDAIGSNIYQCIFKGNVCEMADKLLTVIEDTIVEK